MQTHHDILLFQLHKLHYTETKAKAALESLSAYVTSTSLRREMEKQIAGADSHLFKLERIFDYLMHNPSSEQRSVVKKLLQDTKEMLSSTHSPHLRDYLLVNFLQNLNACKVSGLRMAYIFSIDLGLDTVSDLLQQLLESAYETGSGLSAIGVEEFNNIEDMVQT